MVERKKVGEAFVEVGADIGPLERGMKAGEKEVASGTAKMEKSLGNFKGFAGAAMAGAAAAVGAFVIKSVKDYAVLDKAMSVAARNIAKLGGTYAEARVKLEAYADKVEATTNFQDTEAITTLNRLVVLTQNYTRAMQLNGMAMDLAVANDISLARAAELVGDAFQGGERGVKALANELGIVGDKAEDVGYVFEELHKRTVGMSKATDELSSNWNGLLTDISNVGERIAKFLTPAMNGALKVARELVSTMQSGNWASYMSGAFLFRKNTAAGPTGKPASEAAAAADIARKARANQLEAQATERQLKADREQRKHAENRLEILQKEREMRNQLVETIAAEQAAAEDYAMTLVGPVSSGMEKFFSDVIQGTEQISGAFEALGKSIIKSMLGAVAVVLEQEAAAALVRAGAALAGIVTAPMAPGFFAQAALLASGAGALRAVAANMAEGGLVKSRPGGTVVNLAERGEDEYVVPARKMGGFGGGLTIEKFEMNNHGVKDAAQVLRPSAVATMSRKLMAQIDDVQRRRGVALA